MLLASLDRSLFWYCLLTIPGVFGAVTTGLLCCWRTVLAICWLLGHVPSCFILPCPTSCALSECSFTFCGGHTAHPASSSSCWSKPPLLFSRWGWGSCPRGNPLCGTSSEAVGCQNQCYALRLPAQSWSRQSCNTQTSPNHVVSAVLPVISSMAAWSLLTQHWSFNCIGELTLSPQGLISI